MWRHARDYKKRYQTWIKLQLKVAVSLKIRRTELSHCVGEGRKERFQCVLLSNSVQKRKKSCKEVWYSIQVIHIKLGWQVGWKVSNLKSQALRIKEKNKGMISVRSQVREEVYGVLSMRLGSSCHQLYLGCHWISMDHGRDSKFHNGWSDVSLWSSLRSRGTLSIGIHTASWKVIGTSWISLQTAERNFHNQ